MIDATTRRCVQANAIVAAAADATTKEIDAAELVAMAAAD
jgi:hypothetical protein